MLAQKLNEIFSARGWAEMAGTEGTWEYQVVAATRHGRVGVRDFTHSGSPIRVRVEPVPGDGPFPALSREAGWKQPGDSGQPRHSVVVPSGTAAELALELTLRALGVGVEEHILNPSAPSWVLAVVERVANSPAPAATTTVEVAELAPIVVEFNHPVVAGMVAEATGLRTAAAELNSKAEAVMAKAEERVRKMLEEVKAEVATIVAQANVSVERAAALETAAGQFAQAAATMAALGYDLPKPAEEPTEPTYTVDQLRALGRKDLRELLRSRGDKPSATLGKDTLIRRLLGLS